jgi:hypothetical protein
MCALGGKRESDQGGRAALRRSVVWDRATAGRSTLRAPAAHVLFSLAGTTGPRLTWFPWSRRRADQPCPIEHILPQNHGGTGDLRNLGIACARYNAEKGVRHDHKRVNDARLQEIIAKLSEKRLARWRDPRGCRASA